MNAFDLDILAYLHKFTFKSYAFDHAINTIATLDITKGVPMMALFWWAWTIRDEHTKSRHRILIATIFSAFISLALGRVLAHALPFRIRPLFDQNLPFTFPLAQANQTLRSWSAFPSDHAMLWSAVATGIYICSKRIGLIAFIFTAVFICFPRVYIGLHHPTDILAGAFLGIAVTLILTREKICAFLVRPFERWSIASPQSFYLIAFIASYGFATTFSEARDLANSLGRYIGHGPRIEAQDTKGSPEGSPDAFAYASTPRDGPTATAQNPQLADNTPQSSW